MQIVYALQLLYVSNDEAIQVVGIYSTAAKAWEAAAKYDEEWPGPQWYRVQPHELDK